MTLYSCAAAAIASVPDLQHEKGSVIYHRIARFDLLYHPMCSQSVLDPLLANVLLLIGTREKRATTVLCEQESLAVKVCT